MNSFIVKTTCAYCGVGCGVLAAPDGQGGAIIAGDPDHPANYGRLCVKGAALGETLNPDTRLVTPKIEGTATTWNRAIERIARGFEASIKKHGPDSVAMYLSGQMLTEDYYVANKFMKGFVGSSHCDTNSRLCMASSVAGHKRAFGSDTVPGSYEDLENADLILLVGSNTAWCHPVLFQRMQRARESRGTRIVNIDVRRTTTSVDCDMHLSIKPGMDAVLFAWLLVQLAKSGATDAAFIGQHTSGFDVALAKANEIAPSLTEVSRLTGLDADDITTLSALVVGTPRLVTCYSQGVNQSAQGTDKVNAILNIHLATGRIGKVGMGPFSLTGQPNAMGGREVGGLSNQLAAHMGFSAPELDRVQRFWNAPHMVQREGLKAVDLFEGVAQGRIKALWIMHTNPSVSLPRADFVRGSLGKLDFLAVSEAFSHVDGLLERAHVVLPASPWGEKDGTVTNSERRISRQRRFLAPIGEAKPDWWAIVQVAKRMGFGKAFDYTTPAAIFREHARLSAFENAGTRDFDIGGLAPITDAAYDEMAPVQWPVPANTGTPRLFGDGRFFHADQKARFIAVDMPALREAPSPRYPFLLNTGRVRDHWHTMSRTRLSQRLSGHIREPYVEVHPDDAQRLGLKTNAYAQVRSAHAVATLRVEVHPGQQPGLLFAPIHWNDISGGGGRVSALMSAFTDPFSGQPESKAVPASITPLAMRSFGFLVARTRLDLPRWLVHSRFTVVGGEAIIFACQCLPAELEALISNYLPALGARSHMRDESRQVFRTLVTTRQRIETMLFIGPQRNESALDWTLQQFESPSHNELARRALLAGQGASGNADRGPLICACNNVRASVIAAAIAKGASDVDAVGKACKAGTTCGSCKPEIKTLLAEFASLAPPEKSVDALV